MDEIEVYGATSDTSEDYMRLAEKLERYFNLIDQLQEEEKEPHEC